MNTFTNNRKQHSEKENRRPVTPVSQSHSLSQKMDKGTAQIQTSSGIAEKRPRRSESDVARKHQRAVLKSTKTTRNTKSERTFTDKKGKTASRKPGKTKATPTCRSNEVGSQEHAVCDGVAERTRNANSKGARNTTSLKTKPAKKNKKDNLTESSVPAKRSRKQAGSAADKSGESVRCQKRTNERYQLKPDVIGITSKNTSDADNLEKPSHEQEVSRAKADARAKTPQLVKNQGKNSKSQSIDAKNIVVPAGKSLFPVVLVEHMLSEISSGMRDACDFIREISTHQNNFPARPQSHCGSCGQADHSSHPLDQQYWKVVMDDLEFIVGNYFNKSIKNIMSAEVENFCQNVDKLLKEIFEVMKTVERNKYLLLRAIQNEIDRHTFCAASLVVLLRLMELQQSIVDASEKALDSLRQVVQLCLQMKQIASFLDFFSEELRPDSLLDFCTLKKAVCSKENERKINVEFEHLEIANESPLCLQSYLPIVISAKISSVECKIEWSLPTSARYELSGLAYTLAVWNGIGFSCHHIPVHQTTYLVRLEPGRKFKMTLTLVGKQGRVLALGELEGKAVFDGEELQTVYEKALAFVGDEEPGAFEILHRCNPAETFEEIREHGNIMPKHRKDSNGHNASPINADLDGLFFYGCKNSKSLPITSPFGNLRLIIGSLELLDPKKNNLYFADFYCNTTRHYVTIVASKKGSKEDESCRSKLIRLDPENNKFLRVKDQSTYIVTKKLNVEIFYTENVDISHRTLSMVVASGRGKALPDGLPHNKGCRECNLHPEAKDSKLDEKIREVYSTAGRQASKCATASPGNADFLFHVHSLGMSMILQLFNSIRASCFKTEKGTLGSTATDEELQSTLQNLRDLGETLLMTPHTRLSSCLTTSDLTFKSYFATFERACDELRDYIEQLERADSEEQRNQLAQLCVSPMP